MSSPGCGRRPWAPTIRGPSGWSCPRARGGELLEINVDGKDTDSRRFYERHGYLNSEPGQDQPLLYYYYYYYRELPDAS